MLTGFIRKVRDFFVKPEPLAQPTKYHTSMPEPKQKAKQNIMRRDRYYPGYHGTFSPLKPWARTHKIGKGLIARIGDWAWRKAA